MSMKKCFSALLIIVLMIQKPTFFNLASDRVAESFGSFSVYLFDGELYGSRQAYRHMAARRQVRIEAVNRSMNMKFNIF